jgi:NitT/TauT family transport system substrate-binding protein
MHSTHRLIPVILLVLVLAACQASSPSTTGSVPSTASSLPAPSADTPTPDPTAVPITQTVNLQLDLPISGVHAPFVAGIAEGFFAAEGIELRVIGGSGSGAAADLVASREALVAFVDAAAMTARVSDGEPLEMVACFIQQTPLAVISTATLNDPNDLRGAEVGRVDGDDQPVWEAFKSRNGLSSGDLTEKPLAAVELVQALLDGRIGTALGRLNDEGVVAKARSDGGVSTLRLFDTDVTVLAQGLVFHADTVREEPELVRRIVSASVRSWQFAADHPAQAIDDFMAAYPEVDREIAAHQLELTIGLLHTEASLGQSAGYMVDADWQATVDLLTETGALEGEMRVPDLYSNTFLFRH